MLIAGKHYRSIWFDKKTDQVKIIDQRKLPHAVEIENLNSLEQVVRAISEMYVRGAPLIGVAAAFGFSLAMKEDPSDQSIKNTYASLVKARPTAVNLEWACQKVLQKLSKVT